MKPFSITVVSVALALGHLVACKRVHEFDPLASDSESATAATDPVSNCGLNYRELFDVDPFGGELCTPSDALAHWRSAPNVSFEAPGAITVVRHPWSWSAGGSLISDTDATGGHLIIEIQDTDSESDTVAHPTERVSEILMSPFYDVRGCKRAHMSALHRAEQQTLTQEGWPSPAVDIYGVFIDVPGYVHTIGQADFFNPNDGLIARRKGDAHVPAGGLLDAPLSYVSWVFAFVGEYTPPETAFWHIDNFTTWGENDTDCALYFPQVSLFDSTPFSKQVLPAHPERWSCIDASPPPEHGSSWAWSDADNTVPSGSDGHLSVSSGYAGTEAGAFSEVLLSPVFDVGPCGRVTIELSYSYKGEIDVLAAPYATITVGDPSFTTILEYKEMTVTESGITHIELETDGISQIQIEVLYRGGTANPHDYHMKLDDFSIFGTL